MKSLTQGHIKTALNSLRTARWRSFLTMLGIIVGVVSVVSVVGIGEGIKEQIGGQIKHYGGDLVTVRPGQINTGNASNSLSALANITISGSLTDKDIAAVRASHSVEVTAPLNIVSKTVKGDLGVYKNGAVIGTTVDLPQALNQTLSYGIFFAGDEEEQHVAVLGQDVVTELFDEDVPLGRSFTIGGQEFLVRGIFNQFTAAPLSGEVDFNKAVFIPYGTAQNLTNKSAPLYEILAKPVNKNQTDNMAASIKQHLQRVHGGQNDFAVLKQNENLAATNNILDLLTTLIGGVAAISLFVGGVGIMNVMLVSVTERMHEIGIRKALGATNRQILNQFLIEATVLSLTGGLIGIIVSFLIDVLLRIFTDLQPVISWWVVLVATSVSVLVGIIFGSAPAIKAARKHPIDALRSE